MAAPINNTNAKGNKGGRPYSKENRKKAAMLKGLVLDYAIKIMRSKSQSKEMKFLKQRIVERILSTCVPRPIELSGSDDKSIEVKWSK